MEERKRRARIEKKGRENCGNGNEKEKRCAGKKETERERELKRVDLIPRVSEFEMILKRCVTLKERERIETNLYVL